MTDTPDLTKLFEAAAEATRIVQQAHVTALKALGGEGRPLAENGHGHLVNPMDTLQKLQDARVAIATALDAMGKVAWPVGGEGGHYARYAEELKAQIQAQSHQKYARAPMTANTGTRQLATGRAKA